MFVYRIMRIAFIILAWLIRQNTPIRVVRPSCMNTFDDVSVVQRYGLGVAYPSRNIQESTRWVYP